MVSRAATGGSGQVDVARTTPRHKRDLDVDSGCHRRRASALEYADNRSLYIDERSLLQNLVELAPFDFTSILTESQLAPPGFLVLERLLVRLPFPKVPAARLVAAFERHRFHV